MDLKIDPNSLNSIFTLGFAVQAGLAWIGIVVHAWRQRVPMKKIKDHGEAIKDLFDDMVEDGTLIAPKEDLKARINERIEEISDYAQELDIWERNNRPPNSTPERPEYLTAADDAVVLDNVPAEIRDLAAETFERADRGVQLSDEIGFIAQRYREINTYIGDLATHARTTGSVAPTRPDYLPQAAEGPLLGAHILPTFLMSLKN